MRGGQLAQIGNPFVVYTRPVDRATAEFLGDAVMLDAWVEGYPGHVLARSRPGCAARPARGRVQLMLRPEQIRIDRGRPDPRRRRRHRLLRPRDHRPARAHLAGRAEPGCETSALARRRRDHHHPALERLHRRARAPSCACAIVGEASPSRRTPEPSGHRHRDVDAALRRRPAGASGRCSASARTRRRGAPRPDGTGPPGPAAHAGTNPKRSPSWSRSSREFIRIRVRLSHWRHDAGVHLRRSLGRQEQPQAVLASLGGDLDEPVAHRDAERGLGVRRAEVVRLVDDDAAADAARLAPGPQVVEDGEGDGQLLLVAVVAAEVEHRRGRAPRDDVGRRTGAEGPRPRPLERPRGSRAAGPGRSASGSPSERRYGTICPASDGRRSRSAMRRSSALYSARSTTGSSRSTAAWARRGRSSVKRTRRGSGRRRTRGTRRHGRRGVPASGWHRRPARRAARSRCWGRRPPSAAGAEQDALEQHAERVRLARAALAAPERVPVEPVGHERDAHRLWPARWPRWSVVQAPRGGAGWSCPGRPERGLVPSGPLRRTRRGAADERAARDEAPTGGVADDLLDEGKGPMERVEPEVLAGRGRRLEGPLRTKERPSGDSRRSAVGDRSTSSFAAMRP